MHNYTAISQSTGVHIFESFGISLTHLTHAHPPHMQPSLCTHAVICQYLFGHVLAYAITADSVCTQQLLVPPLVQWCFFSASCHNSTCTDRWVHFRERKAPFATTSSKKEGGLRLGLLSRLYGNLILRPQWLWSGHDLIVRRPLWLINQKKCN